MTIIAGAESLGLAGLNTLAQPGTSLSRVATRPDVRCPGPGVGGLNRAIHRFVQCQGSTASGAAEVVLKRKPHERIELLFERQLNAYANGLSLAALRVRTFVGGLHKSWPASGDDVATHLRQCFRNPFGLFELAGSTLASDGIVFRT